MWWLKTKPAVEPVTPADVKRHTYIDGSADDEKLAEFISTARQYLEDLTGRAFVRQTWVYARDHWPCGNEMRLPKGKLLRLVGLTYLDDAGNLVNATDSVLPDTNSPEGRIVAKNGWPPSTAYPLNPIQVEYECGYGEPTDVPDTIKQAIYLLVAHYYENREAVVQSFQIPRNLEFGVDKLIMDEVVRFDESR